MLRLFSRCRLPGRCMQVYRPFLQHQGQQPRAVAAWAPNVLAARNGARSIHQVQLRDYQEECIEAVIASIGQGHKRLGISLATGAGKTVIFTHLIDRIKTPSKNRTQTLILAHRRELVEQAARHCSNAYPSKSVEIEMGKLHATGTADITIASIQSINSGDRLHKFDPQRFKLVLVDEAHHIVASGYLNVLEHFGLRHKQDNSPYLVGVSATFSRFDGLRLGTAIDEIVYHKDYVDMIGDKWLSDVIFTTVESSADLSRVKNGSNGDFLPGELSSIVNTEEVNEITVRAWRAKAAGRKSTLVFCVDLNHIAGLCQTFRRHGFEARYVTGETPKHQRGETLDAFKRGDFPVLINCGVFTEGTDIPNIDCVVLARPTRSRNLLVQMIGRGMRLHASKTNCHIIDMVSSLSTGVVSTPTLFGLDPAELVKEASVDEMKMIKDRKEAEKKSAAVKLAKSSRLGGTTFPTSASHFSGQVTFTEYDSVIDLVADSSGERHIRAISPHAWVQINPKRYIMTGPNRSYIRLEQELSPPEDPERIYDDGTLLPIFSVYEIRALPSEISKSPYAAPRQLLQAATFPDAVHGADSWVSEKWPRWLIHSAQPWRRGLPTDGQIKFLNQFRGEGDKLKTTDITKGKAADMITKIRHGARGRFAGLDAKRKSREKKLAAQKEKKAREKVTVGPLAN